MLVLFFSGVATDTLNQGRRRHVAPRQTDLHSARAVQHRRRRVRRREGFAVGPDHADRAKHTDYAINALEQRRTERRFQRTHALSLRQLVESGHQPRAARPQSNAFIDYIGRTRDAAPGLRSTAVRHSVCRRRRQQPRMPITFVDYGSESDTGFRGETGYPIPTEATDAAELHRGRCAGGGTSGDRHLIVVDRDRWVLFELFATRWNNGRWEAGSGAVFDLSSNARRPEGWTSADAAGLAILPGLVRYEEAASGREIRHAFRVTVRATNGYVWPASHRAGSHVRRAADGRAPAAQGIEEHRQLSGVHPAIFRAMQTYGLIVADNGSDMYISGAMDSRWNNDELNPAFRSLTAGDFEVVQLGFR